MAKTRNDPIDDVFAEEDERELLHALWDKYPSHLPEDHQKLAYNLAAILIDRMREARNCKCKRCRKAKRQVSNREVIQINAAALAFDLAFTQEVENKMIADHAGLE